MINFGHSDRGGACYKKRAMPTRTAAWPIEALPFEEILNPVVESFLDSEAGRAFDWSRSAIRQLYDRVDELGDQLQKKDPLLALIRDRFGEFDCLAICTSGIRDPQLKPEDVIWQSVEPPSSNPRM